MVIIVWLFLLNIVVTILGHYFVEINRCYANRIHNHISKFFNHKSSVTKTNTVKTKESHIPQNRSYKIPSTF